MAEAGGSAPAAKAAPAKAAPPAGGAKGGEVQGRSVAGEYGGEASKGSDVRGSNILAARGVANAVRTSLGPRGMDKMIESGTGEVVITNDGATILKEMEVLHPAAKMLVGLSQSQDVEAGDGTTSVVVIAGALLNAAQSLLERGIHPVIISDAFQKAADKAVYTLRGMASKVELTDRESLIKAATTSLSSKVVSQYSSLLAPIAVDAVLRVAHGNSVDLEDIKVVSRLGGTIDDSELVDGLLFKQGSKSPAGAPKSFKDAKIGLVQFCLSAPKTDMENSIVVSDYAQMDKILREERQYLLNMCKKIKATGCNVLLVQKSILRDAYNALSLHFLAKLKIMVITDIERTDVEFISKTLGCLPVAHIDSFTADKLGTAGTVAEESTGEGKLVRVTGVPNAGTTVSVLVRGSNKLVVDEAARSLHDALCVVRCIVKSPYLIVGGGAPEIELATTLGEYAAGLSGAESYAIRAWAEALEIIPYTLAENAGLNAIKIVTELRARHRKGEKSAGINVKKGTISDVLLEEHVLQPLLVNTSALNLATETVRQILKIDDIVDAR